MSVEFEARDRVAIITLHRAEARNAVNETVARGIEDAIDRLEGDDDIWCGIIAADGPVFSAGADLKAVSAGKGRSLSTERGGFAGLVWRERTKPLIAAVDGAAVAGGCEIVLACDLVVASTRAWFALPEVKRSLLAGSGTVVLPRRLPFNLAMELAITGDAMDATRAHEHGLVNVLCEPDMALAEALELAARVNVNAPLAVRATRQAILEGATLDVREGIRVAGRHSDSLAATEDFREGPLAFIEKREAVWKGR